MQAREQSPAKKMEECDVIFYQGIFSSQTKVINYIFPDGKVTATTGQEMWWDGREDKQPLGVMYRVHLGDQEIEDVNLKPFSTFTGMINPINWIAATATAISNYSRGYRFSKADTASAESVAFHAPNISEISIGQETDLLSLQRKYESWKKRQDRTEGFIGYAVSKGTIPFLTYQEVLSEMRLLVLEGAVDSIPNVLPKRIFNTVKSETVAKHVMTVVNSAFSFFEKKKVFKYSSTGSSPLDCVERFPQNVPIVFISSKKDEVVPFENTKRIAQALKDRGKNDVYFIELEHSRHAYYTTDHPDDIRMYRTCLHAVFELLGLKHEAHLAEQGRQHLEKITLQATPKCEIRLR